MSNLDSIVESVNPAAPAAAAAAPAAPAAGTVSIPLVITRRMEANLRLRGYSTEAINAFTPETATAILAVPMLDPVAPETPSTALAIRAPSSLAVVDPTALALALREPGLLDISPAVSQRLAELDVVHEIAARERDEAAAIVVDVRRARWKALLDAPLNPAAPTCTCGRALLPPRITRDMKATLRQRGYDDAAIAGLTVLGATNIIAGNVVEAPYTSPRFCSEKCWLSHQNAIIALDPYDAEDVDRAVAAAEAQVDRRVAQTVALMLQPSAALMLQPSAEQRAREALHAAAATLHDIIAHRGPGTERSRHAEALYPLARQRARAVWAAWLASLMDALVARGDQYGPPPRRHCVACSLPLPEAVDAAIVRTCEKAGCAKKATADSTDDTWGRPCGWCNLWFKHPESPAPPGFDADADLGLTILGLPAGPSAAIADAITDVTRTVRRGRSTRKPPGLWAGPIIAIDEHETFVDGIDPRRSCRVPGSARPTCRSTSRPCPPRGRPATRPSGSWAGTAGCQRPRRLGASGWPGPTGR